MSEKNDGSAHELPEERLNALLEKYSCDNPDESDWTVVLQMRRPHAYSHWSQFQKRVYYIGRHDGDAFLARTLVQLNEKVDILCYGDVYKTVDYEREVAQKREKEERECGLRSLEKQYACSIAEKPQWMVWGKYDGAKGVLYWIRPGEGDRFAAMRFVKELNKLGGQCEVKKTEWHPDMDGDSGFDSFDVLDL